MVPVRTANRMAWHHSTQASPASGSGWVRSETVRASTVRVGGSSRHASATGAVRISEPLPAVRPVRRWRSSAAARARAANPGPAGSAGSEPKT